MNIYKYYKRRRDNRITDLPHISIQNMKGDRKSGICKKGLQGGYKIKSVAKRCYIKTNNKIFYESA